MRGIHCKAARTLLSEALDQRLGSTDARLFRAHLLACQSCRRTFDELRRLQSATAALPKPAVSADFKSRLIERISAGEGSPPAILRGPVPLAHRVKLFASGAATAAALLLSLWLIVDGLGQTKPEPGRTPVVPNGATGNDAALAGLTTPGIDPLLFTRRAVDSATTAFNGLHEEAPAYQRKPYKLAIPRLLEKSENARKNVRILRGLNGRSLELPIDIEQRITEILVSLDEVVRVRHRSQDPSVVRFMIERIRQPKPLTRGELARIRLKNVDTLELKPLFPRFTVDDREWNSFLKQIEEMLRGVDRQWAGFDRQGGVRFDNRAVRVRMLGADGEIKLFIR